MNTRLTAGCALLLAALAQQASAFDLNDAWRAAQGYNSDYAAARADLDAGRELTVQGRAQLLPQVGLSGNYSHNTPATPSGMNSYDSSGYGVQLSQPLFDVAKYAAWQKGKIGSSQAELAFVASEQQLLVTVARAYFDVLLAQDTLAANRASKKAYATQLAQAKTSFELGTATITDTHEAQAGYDGAVAKEIAAESQLEISRNNLLRLTGLSPDAIQPLKDSLPLDTPTPATLEGWIQLAVANSPSLKSAEQSVELAKAGITEKRANQLPTITLNAGYNEARSNAFGSVPVTRGNSVGVTVSLPLFAGGGIDSQVREAVARKDSAADKLESARRQLREDVRRAWLGVTSGAALVRAQQQLVLSANSKVESTRLGKEVGIRTNLDLLQAEQAYYDAVTSLATARYDYLTARLQLAQAAGTLDEALLQQVNQAVRR